MSKPARRTPVPLEIALCQDNEAGYISYVQDTVNQSRADERGVSLADYIHAAFSLLLQSGARRVLMIGCGGGTLATMLHAKGVKVTMLDINEQSFVIARRHFNLPRGVTCRVADGLAFLGESKTCYDAIVLDAYDGNKIPRQFLTQRFAKLVRAHLADDGVFVVNVIAAKLRDPLVRRVATLLETTWDNVRVLGSREGGSHNALVMAGAVANLKRPKLIMPPRVGRGELLDALKEMDFR
ncbi:MAG TPA: fused MFS/spermidine synthase [Rhizomicrobium sp.]|jgi:spermidine synthase|nr:fused MFS/spermidine synthase [Rhizomicrobium sp.]